MKILTNARADALRDMFNHGHAYAVARVETMDANPEYREAYRVGTKSASFGNPVHVWTEVQCPAYRSWRGRDCNCGHDINIVGTIFAREDIGEDDSFVVMCKPHAFHEGQDVIVRMWDGNTAAGYVQSVDWVGLDECSLDDEDFGAHVHVTFS